MLVLGIDPGTRHLGYGLIKEEAGILSATDYGSLYFSPRLEVRDFLQVTGPQFITVSVRRIPHLHPTVGHRCGGRRAFQC